MPVPSIKSGLFDNASSNNLANQHPETRAGARNKAIGMVAAQGARAIGTYFKKKEAEKTQALSMDIHRSLELQSGLDEATQATEQAKAILADPNATAQDKAQAQQMLSQSQQATQKNTKLLESLLNGKNGKDIAKAYDITFGEEGKDKSINDKNDSMHFQAMQAAMKQAKIDQAKMQQPQQQAQLNGGPPNMGAPAMPKATVDPGLSRLQQFQQGMPARMMANPAYGEAYKQYQDTVKNATATQKNVFDYVSKYQKDRTDIQKQQLHDQGLAAIHTADAESRRDIAKMQEEGRVKAAKIGAGAREFAAEEGLKAARIRADATLKVMGQIKESDMKARLAVTQIDNLNTAVGKAQATVGEKLKDLSNPKRDTKNDVNLKDQINALNTEIASSKQRISDLRMVADQDPEAAATMSILDSMDSDATSSEDDKDEDDADERERQPQ
jgi:hypothetical protein